MSEALVVVLICIMLVVVALVAVVLAALNGNDWSVAGLAQSV